MHLKCIKLAGFKSFVDPTTVSFPSKLCAVVGPNGCGKSNIIDAVRWVMGESSAKHLRGESMTDVIFNGSGGRKPVGQASIELVFDNSDGTLSGEYASYSEVSVRRMVSREGQSNYYLNGSKCRRRDVTDVFLGTGLGPRSYSIIEQGMISNLIESKPEELRVFIEEAAGISKYKERRKDTENRIRRTRENLERLTDIREELGRQLSRLERQAEAAAKYTSLKKEERLLRAQLQALRWQDLDQQAQIKREIIAEQSLQIEALLVDRAHQGAELEKFRLQHSENNDKFNEIQSRYYAAGAEVARIEQSIKHAEDRARELREDLEQTRRNFAESEQHLQSDQSKAIGWQAELAEISQQLTAMREAEVLSADALKQSEQSMQSWQGEWDEFNKTASTAQREVEVQQSRIQHLDTSIDKLGQRIQRFNSERANLEQSAEGEDIELLEANIAECGEELAAHDCQIEEVRYQIEQSRSEGVEVASALSSAREQVQTLSGRAASLEALQQASLGEDDSQRTWLENNQLGSAPRLADGLNVESGWETAVETVLGDFLQAVCVENIEAYAESIATMSAGSVLLLDGAAVTGVDDAPTASQLLAKVSDADQRAETVLAGVLTAENLEEALALRASLAPHQSVISRDGLWFGCNWVRVAREVDASAGVLLRKRDLDETHQQLHALRSEVELLLEQQESKQQALKASEAQRTTLDTGRDVLQQQSAQLQSKLNVTKERIDQIAQQKTRIAEELEESRMQLEQDKERLRDCRQVLELGIESMTGDNLRREQLSTQRDQLRKTLDDDRQRARHDRDKVHELAMREQSVSTQLSSIKEGITRLEVQVARLQERQQTLLHTSEGEQGPGDDLKSELEARLEQRLIVEKELSAVRVLVQQAEHSMRECENERTRLEAALEKQRSALEQQRLSTQELETRAKTIAEQVAEADYILDEVLTNLPEGADESEWERRLQQIESRVQRLGAINLAAVDEFKIESERKTYLDAQDGELNEALETLESAIRKIDRETRTRFRETYDAINHSLQALFPKLFGGGHAYLALTGDDLLDTGVTIMAQPPGKKNSTIHLLSGGEKALTAIALVFSIFKLNPAPFCMLDEVDAPLDDANVGRYARMVKEMSETVQFIYITHNKIAMEMAHQLMGVTMNEPGVSRLVTVDVDKAVELAQ
jgi:chromosome segregation protein